MNTKKFNFVVWGDLRVQSGVFYKFFIDLLSIYLRYLKTCGFLHVSDVGTSKKIYKLYVYKE